MDRVPVSLLGEVTVGAKVGYEALLPAGLPEEFTSKEFAKGRPSASPQPSGGFFFSTNWGGGPPGKTGEILPLPAVEQPKTPREEIVE